ncbi:hypothetical protein [Miniphocaeibacter massiliensis]|uniref:hypothetical protein n=1 Tax=Miniphocaeibacter massiliensis TaxID=2041841 RepID=UPI000C1BBFA8|nr:hypothetical protein [Miniphocaeibacter massiliensis]
MKNLRGFLKLKSKDVLWHLILILSVFIILPAGLKMLLNYLENSDLTKGILNEVYGEGLKSFLNIFLVAEIIEFVLGVRLYLLSGYTRKTVFKLNIQYILFISTIYSLVIGASVVIGMQLKPTGFVFETIQEGNAIKFFIDYFIQFMTISSLALLITYAFKKNYIVGITVGVSVMFLFYLYDLLVGDKYVFIINLFFSLIIILLSIVGSKKVLDFIGG